MLAEADKPPLLEVLQVGRTRCKCHFAGTLTESCGPTYSWRRFQVLRRAPRRERRCAESHERGDLNTSAHPCCTLRAKPSSQTRTPASKVRSCAHSVKLADVTKETERVHP